MRAGLRSDTRARLTFPEVIIFLFALAILGALWPVVYDLLKQNAGELTQGEGLLLQMLLPGILLVLFSVVFVAVARGATR